MSNTEQIQELYKIDVNAIRNLSKLANDLTLHNKLTIPGGLEIIGPLKIGNVNIKPTGEIHVRGLTYNTSLTAAGILNVNGSIIGPTITSLNGKILDNITNIDSSTTYLKEKIRKNIDYIDGEVKNVFYTLEKEISRIRAKQQGLLRNLRRR